MKIEILRIEESTKHTLGILIIDKTGFCCTLERPWLNNKQNESRIPTGEYLCKAVNSVKFGKTFEVQDVPCRTEILFHPGNAAENSKGCILLGSSFSKLRGDRIIENSGKTFRSFIDFLDSFHFLKFDLKIVDCFGIR